jgi:hypothetical protein
LTAFVVRGSTRALEGRVFGDALLNNMLSFPLERDKEKKLVFTPLFIQNNNLLLEAVYGMMH